MEQPPSQNDRRNQYEAEVLIALVPSPLPFATRRGIDLCEVRLGPRINQVATLPGANLSCIGSCTPPLPCLSIEIASGTLRRFDFPTCVC
jgi:hypothetical protein